jgi:hypothetical protein
VGVPLGRRQLGINERITTRRNFRKSSVRMGGGWNWMRAV